ncbi:MAG: twin-arginine translocase subunit TatC [Rikenellaceae bacterium]
MAQMTFWDHLEDLRWSICRVVGVWLALAVVYFLTMPYIFDNVILAPCNSDFILYEVMRDVAQKFGVDGDVVGDGFTIQIVNIELIAPLFIHISTAFMLSVVTAVPYLLYEVWKYISPALYEAEQRGVKRAFIFGSLMFFIGVSVGYFLIYPLTLRFLTSYQLSPSVENMLSLSSYIDNFTMLIIAMGIAFELPILLWLLSLLGIVTREMLKEYRRHAVVVIVIIAAVITPTSDPFTLTLVALPLYMLYELSLLVVKSKKKEEEQEEEQQKEE